jgi:hypothetical protein
MKDKEVFIIPDLRCSPFAYPKFSKRNAVGDQTVTYPQHLTNDLMLPQKRKNALKKRKLVKQEQGSSDEFESDSDPPDLEELARDAKRKKLIKQIKSEHWR